MTSEVVSLTVAACDPQLLARFWAGVLDCEIIQRDAAVALSADNDNDTGIEIRFVTTDEAKTAPNQMHFDLTSESSHAQQWTEARALALGGRHLDVGQRPEEGHLVLADPEGNEFCVVEAGNNFLAGCGRIGALSSDGTQQVGYFWSNALGWPLVWGQGEETAIQSPRGGTKISWGGPPVRVKTGRNRLHFDLRPTENHDWAAEVERLVSLGASAVGDRPPHGAGVIEMLDPDGNEFRVLSAQ